LQKEFKLKINFLILMVAMLFQACATKTPKTEELLKHHSGLHESYHIKKVPFINQEINNCGPATLAMMMKFHQQEVGAKTLASQMITPKSNGTFNMDMISAVRRQGMLGVEISEMKDLMTEIQAGHPVIVFQNLGFDWIPNWHYALAIGYDLDGPDIFLHSGEDKNKKVDLRLFERSWGKGGNWGLVVLPPGSLAASADDLAHAEAISGLELAGKLDDAEVSYETVLNKWPKSLPNLIGMGNVLYAKKDFLGSVDYLTKATQFHPTSSVAWHNLANAQGAAGKSRDAKSSAHKAISLATESENKIYQESLKEFL
jgi:uncharacterized protein YvpB